MIEKLLTKYTIYDIVYAHRQVGRRLVKQIEKDGTLEKPKKVLIINGSLSGNAGNTAVLLRAAATLFKENHEIESRIMALTEHSCQEVLDELEDCGGVVIGTGTHWDNHSSHLQRFIEDATHTECTPLWLGKPLGIIVTAHSVGDSSVIQTLMRTFNNFGVMIPPCCAAGLTLVGQEALTYSKNPHLGDVNCPEDLPVIVHNICVGMGVEEQSRAWFVSRAALDKRWIAPINLGQE